MIFGSIDIPFSNRELEFASRSLRRLVYNLLHELPRLSVGPVAPPIEPEILWIALKGEHGKPVISCELAEVEPFSCNARDGWYGSLN